MAKIILFGFILLLSCSQDKLTCETDVLQDGIWLSFGNDSSFINRVPIDSVKFKFIEPSLGKDSVQKNVFRKKDNIQGKQYLFAFTNIIISKNTKIYISFLNQQYLISDIKLVPYERKYFAGSSEMECSIKGYKVNGVESKDYPFIVNVNM